MSSNVDVAIIGAGPYGLSVSAYLTSRNIQHRIVGSVMEFWRTQMPKDMLLKSEGFASNLGDPAGNLTIGNFCAEKGINYADMGIPVALDTFCAYGQAFQQRLVPHLEDQKLVHLARTGNGFTVRLGNGDEFIAQRVVLAVGVSHFRHIPPELADMPPELVTHSSEHRNPERFKGRAVTVVGAGSSAVDLATSLFESGAKVQLLSRRAAIDFHSKMPLPRSLRDKSFNPMSGIGLGWPLMVFCYAPFLIHRLPASFRLRSVKRMLGPSSGWFMKDRFATVPRLLGQTIKRAFASDAGVHLEVVGRDGVERSLVTDHVIAATGYRPDLNRLQFLSPELRAQLKTIENAPILSPSFESSVPGLYFVGAAAANSFGPLMRFADGARFAARQVSKHLSRNAASVPAGRPSKTADGVLQRG